LAGEPPAVVLGVAGGIAAYKACEVLRLFTESGHRVRVVPTASALRFVGAPTWAALSGQPVADDVWADVHEVPHVALGRHGGLHSGAAHQAENRGTGACTRIEPSSGSGTGR